MEEEQIFDKKAAELKELELLNNIGMDFTVNKRITGIFSKKKIRTFSIKPPYMGVMDRLSYEYIQLHLEETKLKGESVFESLNEAKITTYKNARRMGKIVAIAVIGNSPWYPLLILFLPGYFYMRINSKKLYQLANIINVQANYPDFIDSTRYFKMSTTTKPQLVETETSNEG